MRTRSSSLLLLLALGAAAGVGCGSLDNAPFLNGTVRGRLVGADPSVALVSVVGSPGIRSSVEADGRFELSGVPAGQVELFAMASQSQAALVPVMVLGGRSVDVGDVASEAAGSLILEVVVPASFQSSFAQASVVGTPFQRRELSAPGSMVFVPLPLGCYTVQVSVPGFPDQQVSTCIDAAAPSKTVRALLTEPVSGPEGCNTTGCAAGLHCAPDGRCLECVEDAHCGGAGVCRNNRCEGTRGVCAPCAGDHQCASGQCEDLPHGEVACVEDCGSGGSCRPGFLCRGGDCLPAEPTGACDGYR